MVLHPATSAENDSCTPTPWHKKKICTLPPQLIMPPAPLPPGKKKEFLHPATSTDSASCTPTNSKPSQAVIAIKMSDSKYFKGFPDCGNDLTSLYMFGRFKYCS